MSFPRYPAYKPSGVEWLGEVPEHWQVKPLKRVADIQTGLAKGKEVEPEGSVEVPFLRVANVQDGFLDLENVHTITISESSLNRYLLRPGDVLMNEGGDFDKLGRGCIWDGTINPCIHQNHVFAVRPHSIRPSWLNVYTSSTQANSYFISRSKQSTNLASISSSNLMDLLVPIAPDSETEEILDFLNRETAKIDALIAEQQRLIELLQEKRQAVISHAVTKGLNQDAPMKDSGVEWLGEVPEHWEVRKTSQLFIGIGSGTTPKSDATEYYEDGAIPWVVTGDLNDSVLGTCQNRITEKAMAEHTTLRLYPAGSVAVAMYGATIGKASVLDFEATVNQACCVLPPSSLVLSKYLLGFILAARKHLLSIATGGGQPNINQEVIRSLRIPLPSLDEQVKIVSYLESVTGEMDLLLKLSDQQVLLLQERRSALISAAVTGQIDVRGLVPVAEAA